MRRRVQWVESGIFYWTVQDLLCGALSFPLPRLLFIHLGPEVSGLHRVFHWKVTVRTLETGVSPVLGSTSRCRCDGGPRLACV